MIVYKAVVSGIDHTADAGELVELSTDYPFTEWAVLRSMTNSMRGDSKYPSVATVKSMAAAGLEFSCHLCGGGWLGPLCQGQAPPQEAAVDPSHFVSLQLNLRKTFRNDYPKLVQETGAENVASAIAALGFDDITLQTRGPVPDDIILELAQRLRDLGEGRITVRFLFDASSGSGRFSPVDQWPDPLADWPTEYAGGLDADRIPAVLEALVERLPDNASIALQMETGARFGPKNHSRISAARVRGFLEPIAPFVC